MNKLKIGDMYGTYSGRASAFLGSSTDYMVVEVLTNVVALSEKYTHEVIWVTMDNLTKYFTYIGHMAIEAHK